MVVLMERNLCNKNPKLLDHKLKELRIYVKYKDVNLYNFILFIINLLNYRINKNATGIK